MTSPDTDLPSERFALLANGAGFSCAVLNSLRARRYLPNLVVLPEYPPSVASGDNLFEVTPQRRFLQLAEDIAIAYAPKSQQAQFGEFIRQQSFDYLLIACWPYLIEEDLYRSAAKATLNLHPSLLPNFRGANPLEQQLAADETRFGVSLHLLTNRFDRGAIIAQGELDIGAEKPDREFLEKRCATLGVELFIDSVKAFPQGWQPVEQPG